MPDLPVGLSPIPARRRQALALAVIIPGALIVAACGRKGDLELPADAKAKKPEGATGG